MKGFSICCTTCRSRLKVRDARVLGQILPCPKCGSMVLIRQPGSSRQEPGESQRVADAPTRPSHYPESTSFENIDQLLDEPLRLPANPIVGADRWRVSESLPGDPNGPETDAATDADSNSTPAGRHWMQERAASLSAYLFMGGGVLAGVTLAVGLAGWILARPADVEPVARSRDSSTAQAAPDRAAHEIHRTAVPDELLETDEPPEQVLSADKGDPNELVDGEAAVVDTNTLRDKTPSDPASRPDTAGSLVDAAAADGEESDAPEPPARPTPPPRSETPKTESPEAENAEANVASDRRSSEPAANDDLAVFAQWLQNSDTLQAAPVPPDADPAEPADVPLETGRAPQEESTLLQPTRPAPPMVDVALRLKAPISAVRLTDVALIDALRLVTQLSTIPIYLDPDALGRRNLRADRSVNAALRDSNVANLLDAIVRKTGLKWVEMDGYVLVTTVADARGEWVTLRHDVADLTQDDPAVTTALAEWITQLIEPGSWEGQPEGEADTSQPRCEADQSTLVVTHRDTTQFRILEFCEKLRVARGFAPRTSIHQDRIAMGARATHCNALQTSITLRIWRNRSIDEIAAELERQASLRILVNWPALYVAGWSPQDTEKCFYHQKPLGDVLTDWLRAKGLTYRVIDGETLEISTAQAIAAEYEVEFYPLKDGAESATDVTVLSRQILAQVGEAAFPPQGLGAVAFDKASETLIVSLPQPDQIIVAQTIDAKP